MSQRRQVRGFTLTEILVVIGIIGVLIAILLPVMSKVRESSNRAHCMSNLRQIGQALVAYATENKGQFPRLGYKKGLTFPMNVAEPPASSGSPGVAVNPFDDTQYWNSSSGAFFLLIREGRLKPAVFICPSTEDTADDLDGMPANQRGNFKPADAEGKRTRSYSYARLYAETNPTALTPPLVNQLASMKTDFVLAADFGLPICALQTDVGQWPDPGTKGNSTNHKQVGQNALYVDGSVKWQTTNRCGAMQPANPAAPATDPDSRGGPDNIYKGFNGSFCSTELPRNAADTVLEE